MSNEELDRVVLKIAQKPVKRIDLLRELKWGVCDSSLAVLDKVITRLCINGKLVYSYNGYKRARRVFRSSVNLTKIREQYRFYTNKDRFTFTHKDGSHKIDVYFSELEKGYLMSTEEYINGDCFDRQRIKEIVCIEANNIVIDKIKEMC